MQDYPLVVRNSRTPANTILWQMPLSLSELFQDTVRIQADLSHVSKVRMYTEIGSDDPGPSGSEFFCQYSTDGEKTWSTLTLPASLNAGANVSEWQPIPVNAVGDVVIRAVSQGGTGSKVDIKAVHLQAE